ncbi:MAG: nucleotidyltransferase family protein [Candidatus Competibacter sp.]|nr:nucleotidyltransferase family protein [Candidatus Competibacter sp.]
MIVKTTEFELLALALSDCAPDRRQRMDAILDRGVDWTRLVETALTHQVAPLLFEALRHDHVERVPEDIFSAFEFYTSRIRERNEDLVASLLKVLAAMAERSIPVMPFKGPTLGERIYGDGGLKVCRDLDILVRKRDLDRSMATLFELGFVLGDDMTARIYEGMKHFSGQYILFDRIDKIALEPHWEFAPTTLSFELDYDGLWARTGEARFRDLPIRVPAPEDYWLILVIHATKECWCSLKHVCDLVRFIGAHRDADWPLALERARNQGCMRAVAIGLELIDRLEMTRLPATLAAEIGLDRTAMIMADEVIAGMQAGKTGPPDIYRFSRFRYHVRERAADRLRYLSRTLLTPRDPHYDLVSLPRSLAWGYVLVKLGHDYVAKPLWLAGKHAVVKPLQAVWRKWRAAQHLAQPTGG